MDMMKERIQNKIEAYEDILKGLSEGNIFIKEYEDKIEALKTTLSMLDDEEVGANA